ncbi:MAG TPA: carbohydrate binding domain-containing protein [bacterium]|nr:carbohydrate binding domain-containing protein [bacterium]
MKKTFLVVILALGILIPLAASQVGCKGGYPPLNVMVVTATPTQTPPYSTCSNISTPTLIDDMEDNNNGILANKCRTGYWYNYHDTAPGGVQLVGGSAGSFVMASPGVGYNGTGTSLHCVEVSTNSGFVTYGAGFGFSFLTPQGNYNASNYSGIQFYAKSTVGAPTVAFAITDNDVVVSNYAIGPHTLNFTFSSSWNFYQISWTQMIASGNSYGGPTVFDPSRIQQVQWSVGPGLASDVWVDNVSFY